jgi:hypothetical protein
MTCLERFKLEHDISDDDEILEGTCPHFVGYISDRIEGCGGIVFRDSTLCKKCWNREADVEKFNALEELEPLPANPDFTPYVYEPKTTSKEADHSVQKAIYNAGKAAEHSGKVLKEALTLDLFTSSDLAIGTIKDSGDRTEFASGAVRDMREGKGRCDLMPLGIVGTILNNGVFMFISDFQKTGDSAHLIQALLSCGIYSDIPDSNPCWMHTMFLEVAKHFEEGAKKYGENNWQKGIPVKCYIDSAVRHYLKYLRGDKDEPHDRAFVWNILCCIWTCKHHPELNDYKRETDHE